MKLNKNRWKQVKLGEVTHLITDGKHGDCVNDENSGYYFLSAKDVINKRLKYEGARQITKIEFEETHRRTNLKAGDVLITNAGTIGRIAIADNDDRTSRTTFQKSVAVIKPKRDILHNVFCSFKLEADIEKLIGVSAGTAQKNLLLGDLKKHEISLPPLEEQKQIATLFQSIETAMEQVDGQEKNLKKLQQGLVNGLLSTEPVFGNLLNSKNCTATNFGQIAECDKSAEHTNEVSRFVGLEDIEPENFDLQGWGDMAKGTTFTKRFAIGDVLFGKRRAYLKKVAIADFDGVCSGDILVIRAKAKKILQPLLPYYISSDAFIQLAVSTSAGSLSPRTKWKDLAEMEVSITDIKTQQKILNILQQLTSIIQQLKQQKTTLKNLKQKLLSEILG